MSTDATSVSRVKRFVLWCILVSDIAFALLCLVPGARQGEILPYDELCDYRAFIRPALDAAVPYEPTAAEAKDACYPPIAYLPLDALASGRGERWSMTPGEFRLISSILIAQCLGAFLLAWWLPGARVRLAAAFAVVMSPGCVCSVLRGNPSGWSFALVCVFLFWYRSDCRAKRIVAALSLGAATALKISPCLFGVLYLVDAWREPRDVPFAEIAIAASSALILVFAPFALYGGASAVPKWIANAAENSSYYSTAEPLWGFASLANNLVFTDRASLPCVYWFAMATRGLCIALLCMCLFVRSRYHLLLFVGASMAFVTHHDYGGAYLVPAFMAWLLESGSHRGGVWLLLEAVGWFVLLTPLQFPNPCHESWALNGMLQCEFLFVLLICAMAAMACRLSERKG